MPTCEERVRQELESRQAQVAEIRGKIAEIDAPINSYEYNRLYEQYSEEKYDLLLSIDKRISFKLLLSTGGPSDWIEVVCCDDKNCEILWMTYHFADWYDHAERTIDEDSALWEWAEELVEAYFLG